MAWPTSAELEDLVRRFRERTLPKKEWTHAAHLAVGTWHVWRYGPDRALARLRTGIRRLNDAHGTLNTDRSGYHETITRAYVSLIAQSLAAHPGPGAPVSCAQALLAGRMAARDILLSYYSKDVLFSVTARSGWVEPDRAPLRLP